MHSEPFEAHSRDVVHICPSDLSISMETTPSVLGTLRFSTCKIDIRAFHLTHQGAMKLHELISRKHLAHLRNTHPPTHSHTEC